VSAADPPNAPPEPDAPAGAPVGDAPLAESPLAAAVALAPCFCLTCRYELSGLAAGACPECGRQFDPADPTSTSPVATRRPSVRRMLVMLATAAIVAALWHYTIIPNPVRGMDFKLWRWLGQTYGVETWFRPSTARSYHWAGRIYRAEGLEPRTGAKRWELDVDRADRWTLRVTGPGARWRELIGAFNEMKDDVFGVRFENVTHDASTAAFEVTGSKADILSALCVHFGVEVETMVITRDQTYAWFYSPERKRMEARPITPEQALALPRSWAHQGMPLVPPDAPAPEQTPAAPAPGTPERATQSTN
jgi:hypothetical protein